MTPREGSMMAEPEIQTDTTIQRRRTALRWSQGDLAMFVGVSIPTVSLWESRKRRPSKPTVKVLSRLLGVSVDAIEADYPERGQRDSQQSC